MLLYFRPKKHSNLFNIQFIIDTKIKITQVIKEKQIPFNTWDSYCPIPSNECFVWVKIFYVCTHIRVDTLLRLVVVWWSARGGWLCWRGWGNAGTYVLRSIESAYHWIKEWTRFSYAVTSLIICRPAIYGTTLDAIAFRSHQDWMPW